MAAPTLVAVNERVAIALGRQHLPAEAQRFDSPAPPQILVDLDRLLAGRVLIQGNSGAGKSWLLRRMLEQLNGLVQQVVIDPDGEFVTLADAFAFTVITYKEIARIGGGELARHMREQRYSAVLDLSDCGDKERMDLVADFATGLVEVEPALWHPLIVAVDEVQVLAPFYDPGDVDKETRHRAARALADIMGRGRKRGLAGIVATQRLAETAKSVIAKATNYLIGRTTFDRDLARAAGFLGLTIGKASGLRGLADGEFLAMGPAFGPRRVRFTAGPTTTRHVGTTPSAVPPPILAAGAASAMLAALPDVTAPAVEEKPQERFPRVIRGRPPSWTDEEDGIIRAGWAKHRKLDDIIGDMMSAGYRPRSAAGVSMRARVLGLATHANSSAGWIPAEDQILTDGYNAGRRIADIMSDLSAAGFDRHFGAIQMRAIHLGVSGGRVNLWTEAEKTIAMASLKAGKGNRQVLEALRQAGFHRGDTAIQKFRTQNNLCPGAAARWTDEDVAVLRESYAAGISPREVAERLGRKYVAIVSKASTLGVAVSREWPMEDREALVAGQAAGKLLIDIAKALGRPYANVAATAHRMGLSFKQHRGGAKR